MTCPTPGCHRRAVIDQPDGSRLCWGCATRASGVSVAPPPPPKPGRPMIARVWTPAEDGLREQDGDVADLLWQSVHDCVVESRPGRWTVNKTSVASTAAWLRRKAASM